MKYSLTFVILSLFVGRISVAQEGRTLRVKAGEDAAQAYSPHGFYRFPQFTRANVYLKGGARNSGIFFNYNILSGNMQFIAPKGDTLDVGNPLAIDSIVFENHVFVYQEGFAEVIARADSIKLLRKLLLRTTAENVGAYGLSNTTGSITNYKSFAAESSAYNLVVNQNIVLTEDISWYFAGTSGVPVKANKTNLLKLLPAGKQAKAESYLRNNKHSFERENDLKSLMQAIRT